MRNKADFWSKYIMQKYKGNNKIINSLHMTVESPCQLRNQIGQQRKNCEKLVFSMKTWETPINRLPI